MDDFTNRVVKSYELKECVGTGGFGQVYRAHQPSVGREVAVKVILPKYANEPDFVRRFEVEAQLIAHLEHPHIVPLYDYWRDPEGAYLVMRWLQGNLRAAIQHGPWSVEAASRLLDEMAGALSVAHREGIIHRDIKPDNILLDEDDNAYLADFGIAKDLDVIGHAAQDVTSDSMAYVTPEQINGETVTPRTDIYSLGLVLYEMLAGEKSNLVSTTPDEWLNPHVTSSLPHLNRKQPNLPAALNEVLETATARDPAHRYPNVLRFAAAFRAAIPAPQRGPPQPLAEPLTDRELDILKLMMAGLSNQEAAQKLFLTAGTVKWYVNQIYTKLDVHSRHQAVERARQLNLLATLALSIPRAAVKATPPKREQNAASPTSVPQPDFVNPYKGLRAFQEADAPDFFGRAILTEQLLTRLTDQGSTAQFLAVVGPSGSGKSSVVKAGLMPALRQGALPNSARWFITEMLPGTHPLEELEAALLRVAVMPLPGLLDQLTADRRGLVRVAKRVLPTDQAVELVLVIDQFEELFTLVPDEPGRMQFIDNLLSAIADPRSRVRVILTLRADFYDKPLLYPRLAELVRSHTEVIVPLTSAELEHAIVGPAERIGLQFEPRLVATMLNDIGEQPGTLPLMQYALTELFERREGVTLTLKAYVESGGMKGALARRADELVADLDTGGQAATRQLFLRLITLGEGTEDTRRRVLLSELDLLGNERVLDEVIGAFVKYRLLTLDRDPVTRGPTVEIAHEALIRSWSRLQGWLAESREALRIQRRLMIAAAEWENSKYEQSFLASGARLAQFTSLALDSDLGLNTSEKAYLESSIKENDQKIVHEQKRQEREKALERRSRNFLRGLVALLVVATLGAVGLSLVAQQFAVRADRNAAEAQTVALIGGSQAALANDNSDQAIALALEAVTLDPTSARAQVALSEAAYTPGTVRTFVGHSDRVRSVAISPDGHTAISASDDKTVILWDIQTGKMVHRFEGHTDQVISVAFLPDGLSAISGSWDKTLIQWDVQTGAIIRRLEGQPDAIWAVGISPDGRYVASGGPGGNLILWNIQTGKMIRSFVGHTDAVHSARFSADGASLVSASDDQTVILWDVGTGQILHRFEDDHTSPALSAVFSPDDRMILAGFDNSKMILWDIETSQVIRIFYESGLGSTNEVAFSPDGRTILSGGIEGIELLNRETAQQIRHLRGHSGVVFSIAFSPDGRTALSASEDHTLRLWDLEQGQLMRHIDHPGLAQTAFTVTRDNQMAIASWYVGRAKPQFLVTAWDVATGKEFGRYRTDDFISNIAVSPDGKMALFATNNNLEPSDVILWDVATGLEIRRFKGHPYGVSSVAFSPDGRTAASAGGKGLLIVWDVETGQEIRRTTSYESNVWTYVGYSPDGLTLVGCDFHGQMVLWDAATGKEIRHFEGHSPDTFNFVFSANGQRGLSGSTDGTVILWDVATGSILHRFSDHSGPIGSVYMTADGHFGLAGAVDGTTTLWDLTSRELIRRYPAGVGGSVFAPDNRSVLVGTGTGQIEEWRIDRTLDELLSWIHANRYVPELTCDQRDLYRLEPFCAADAALQASKVG